MTYGYVRVSFLDQNEDRQIRRFFFYTATKTKALSQLPGIPALPRKA